jgi:ADP-ribosylglycohydrolase
MDDTRLYDKVLGCLVAGAIGDTLGRPVECWEYTDIVATHGVVDNPFPDQEDSALSEMFGDVGTDDTALAQILCRAYLRKNGRITPEEYAQAWLEEMDPKSFWYCMTNTYELLKAGSSPRGLGALNIVTGSGLMAVNPIGIFNAGDPHQAYLDTVELVSFWQRDLSVLTGAVLAASVAAALAPDATVDTVIEATIEVAPSEPFVTYNERVPNNLRDAVIQAAEIGGKYTDPLELRAEAYEKLLQYQALDPQETMVLTYAIFVAARGDTRLAIIGGANMGRDADTLGALDGQLCGALNGASSLPPEWLAPFMGLRGAGIYMKTARQMAALVQAQARKDLASAGEVLALAEAL